MNLNITLEDFTASIIRFSENNRTELGGDTVNIDLAWEYLSSLSDDDIIGERTWMSLNDYYEFDLIDDMTLAVWIVGMTDGNWWINAEVTA